MCICTILNTFNVQMFKEMREIQSSSGSCDDRQKGEFILSYAILKICIRNLLGCIRYYEFIIIAIYNKQVNLDPHDVLMIYLLKPVCSF